MPDAKGRCSYCNKDVGREKVMACGRCRMVRYCSKECQKASWVTHKRVCTTTLRDALAADPGEAAFNARLSKWINHWRDSLHQWSLWGLDMANNAEDRLETHIFTIVIEERVGGPSPSQLFRMIDGEIMDRAGVIDFLTSMETDDKRIEEWGQDKRGNDTVQIMIVAHSPEHIILVRFLWFSIRDAATRRRVQGDAARVEKSLVEVWQEAMMKTIEGGDASRSGSYIQEAAMKAFLRTGPLA